MKLILVSLILSVQLILSQPVHAGFPLMPFTMVKINELSGLVEYTVPKQDVLFLRTDPYGALTRLRITPRSVIVVNSKPKALHHIFIRDQVIKVIFDETTKEVIRLEIIRK